jgi:hypothetical protein
LIITNLFTYIFFTTYKIKMKQREFILFISIQLLLTTQQQQQCPCIYTTLSNTLTVVNCSYFNLTKLPESLPSSSVIVDFSHNELKNVSLLNKLFENLSFLETFDLSYNSIEFMPDFLNSVNSHELEHFDLSFNNLNKVFPASLPKLYHLKYYSIAGNWNLTSGEFLNAIGFDVLLNEIVLNLSQMKLSDSVLTDYFNYSNSYKIKNLRNNLIELDLSSDSLRNIDFRNQSFFRMSAVLNLSFNQIDFFGDFLFHFYKI